MQKFTWFLNCKSCLDIIFYDLKKNIRIISHVEVRYETCPDFSNEAMKYLGYYTLMAFLCSIFGMTSQISCNYRNVCYKVFQDDIDKPYLRNYVNFKIWLKCVIACIIAFSKEKKINPHLKKQTTKHNLYLAMYSVH